MFPESTTVSTARCKGSSSHLNWMGQSLCSRIARPVREGCWVAYERSVDLLTILSFGGTTSNRTSSKWAMMTRKKRSENLFHYSEGHHSHFLVVDWGWAQMICLPNCTYMTGWFFRFVPKVKTLPFSSKFSIYLGISLPFPKSLFTKRLSKLVSRRHFSVDAIVAMAWSTSHYIHPNQSVQDKQIWLTFRPRKNRSIVMSGSSRLQSVQKAVRSASGPYVWRSFSILASHRLVSKSSHWGASTSRN